MTRSHTPQGPGPLTATLLAGALLALGPAAQAQTLLDATGASAIQGTLNNTASPQYGNTLQQVKNSLGKSQSQGSQAMGPSSFSPSGGSSAGGPAGGSPEGSSPSRDSGATAGGPPSAGPGTYVNGHYVALCSHGGLCLGQLERALRRP
ncbi:hypothetical protein [Vulcanococcus limneticus]|uniref:hypothetical protein n=1 Tax=Vulcanococcus limneticus TaxID=2170428 RepID=UPI00398BF40F